MIAFAVKKKGKSDQVQKRSVCRETCMLLLLMAARTGMSVQGITDLRNHILEKRGSPLTDLEAQTVLHVTDFGAMPDNGKNDYPALVAALQAAKDSPTPVEIRFSPGTYHMSSEPKPIHYNDGVLHLEGFRNIVIEGAGANIMINRSHMSFVYAQNSTNVIVRNFTVDYDPLPFTQGTIRSVDQEQGAFVFEPDQGFPDPTKAPFTSPEFASFGVIMDPSRAGKLMEGRPDHILISKREKLDEGRFRLFLRDRGSAAVLREGDRFVLNCRAGAMARAFDTENITLQNITAYAIPGCFVQGANLSRVNVLECKTRLKGNRMIVSGADGIHVQAARFGPWVENCDFEGLMDDYFVNYNIPHFPGGFWSRNTIISDNTINDCGDHTYRISVRICGFRWGWGYLQPPFHENIFFTNNRIYGDRLPLVELASIENMELTGNMLVSGIQGSPLITVSHSRNLAFRDNQYLLPEGKAMQHPEAVEADSTSFKIEGR